MKILITVTAEDCATPQKPYLLEHPILLAIERALPAGVKWLAMSRRRLELSTGEVLFPPNFWEQTVPYDKSQRGWRTLPFSFELELP